MGETKDDTSKNTDELSYILIRRGTSLRNIDNINDGETVESEITRARGEGELVRKPKTEDSENGEGEERKDVGVVKFDEGWLTAETEYFMHFIENKTYRKLSAFDIASIPENKAYPVNHTTLESLPNWALSMLRDKGYIKIRAEYDSENAAFNNVHEGWTGKTNPYDNLLKLAELLDGDLLQAAYYLAHKNGSRKWGSTEKIAKIRDIQPETVEEAITAVENELKEKDIDLLY